MNLTSEQQRQLDQLFNQEHNNYANHSGDYSNFWVYMDSLKQLFTPTLITFDVIMKLFSMGCREFFRKLSMKGKDSSYKTNVASLLIGDLGIPLALCWIDRVIIHSIRLFHKISVYECSLIMASLPIAFSYSMNIYNYAKGRLPKDEFIVKMGFSTISSVMSGIGLTLAFSKTLALKTGVVISIGLLKKGIITAAIVPGLIHTTIAMKSGILMISIGAGTIKAALVGVVLMVIGSLIMMAEFIILENLRRQKMSLKDKNFRMKEQKNLRMKPKQNLRMKKKKNLRMKKKKNLRMKKKKNLRMRTRISCR